MNTPISPELKSKIDDEAEKYGFRVPYDGSNKFYDESAVTGYIAGATAYAHYKERFEQAKKALENLLHRLPEVFENIYDDQPLQEAKALLASWKEEGKEGDHEG